MKRRIYGMREFFFFNDTATTEIYTLSLHDALPICPVAEWLTSRALPQAAQCFVSSNPGRGHGTAHQTTLRQRPTDRKSTRLNSSHANISYAVFCLKKKYPPPLFLLAPDLLLLAHIF